ncbi:MAG: glycerophosphodiester phosphodiesterase family protein [Clostridiaceae bacterium]
MRKKRLIITGIAIIALGIVCMMLAYFARSAAPVDSSRTSWLKNAVIAHKGIHYDSQGIPENTVPAFEKAIENNCAIELDVSLTKDNKLIVFHDRKLKRLFGIEDLTQDKTYVELELLKFANSNEKIPLFSDVLTFVNGRVPLIIEIKNESEVGKIESMIYDELKDYRGAYAVQSFNPYSLKWFRQNAPEVLRGQLSGSFIISDYEHEYAGTTRLPWYKKFILSNLLMDFESKPNFIVYETENVGNNTLEDLKKLGVPVLGWTIDNKEEYQKVKKYFDNFVVETSYLNEAAPIK